MKGKNPQKSLIKTEHASWNRRGLLQRKAENCEEEEQRAQNEERGGWLARTLNRKTPNPKYFSAGPI